MRQTPNEATHRSGRRRGALLGPRLVRRLAVWLLVLCPLVSVTGQDRNGSADTTPFRIAFSTSTFTEVNQNDAVASVKAWAQVLFRERDLPVRLEATVLNGPSVITAALRKKEIDGISVCTDEYWAIAQHIPFSHFFYSLKGGLITEQFVVLVRQDSGLEQVEHLRQRHVTLFQNLRASLASMWFETLLLQKNLGRTAQFCARVTPATKLSRVILPVFFRQTDACVVTRSGYDTMNELNPQIGRQLKIIASSPEVVPFVFCVRQDYSPPFLDKLMAEMNKTHTSVPGQQVLTVFQCDAIEKRSRSVLDSSIELLENHRRLSAAAESAKAVEQSPQPKVAGPEGGM